MPDTMLFMKLYIYGFSDCTSTQVKTQLKKLPYRVGENCFALAEPFQGQTTAFLPHSNVPRSRQLQELLWVLPNYITELAFVQNLPKRRKKEQIPDQMLEEVRDSFPNRHPIWFKIIREVSSIALHLYF
ncbi:hypothetical protein GQ55_7G262800 [Panicum hallii var. hallii]|uniref:Uncharacterized protein n=1 Tax=Panicum hallii var. hallii TaxID=1504633 RepID=A0A2T7CZ91_9POAL|nr:hypothetical protein GQ55_7G262800 [Panicum hallii var. hallii]